MTRKTTGGRVDAAAEYLIDHLFFYLGAGMLAVAIVYGDRGAAVAGLFFLLTQAFITILEWLYP